MTGDLSAFSMEDLFRMDADSQCATLAGQLVALEAAPESPEILEELMRAAHSLKGAARIVGFDHVVSAAHVMEDCFVQAQKHALKMTPVAIDVMLSGTDLLRQLCAAGNAEAPPELAAFLAQCTALQQGNEPVASTPLVEPQPTPPEPIPHTPAGRAGTLDLRVGSDALNRVLGLAGEGMVAARQLEKLLPNLRKLLAIKDLGEIRNGLAAHQAALDAFVQRSNLHASQLYDEALACRMRPFSDCLNGLRRLVRDLSRTLEKPAVLQVHGAETPVDREILERLEMPLSHLIRNALDHGIELPAERVAAGKPSGARITVEAHHVGGWLSVILRDDGRGIDQAALRRQIVQRGLAAEDMVRAMGEAELLEFLFLPGFSMRDAVTEISGRGVGLDAVQVMARDVRGSVKVSSRQGKGTTFELLLPISLSVLGSLLVTVQGEPYAFPLAQVARALVVALADIESVEGRQFLTWQGRRVGLASAAQVLDLGDTPPAGEEICVLLIEHQTALYGVIVDKFLGNRDLVIQPLDPALGRVRNISAASIMEDGSPVLVADPTDFAVTLEKLAAGGHVTAVVAAERAATRVAQRVLVVEDSLTVRELERKLLMSKGYEVEVAVDGMDGWNALRGGKFDLVITDVDMPRLDGVELTRMIKSDSRLNSLPVLIVSYKDREEDRRRGLDAGADYYLAKSSFQDQALLEAVEDLLAVE